MSVPRRSWRITMQNVSRGLGNPFWFPLSATALAIGIAVVSAGNGLAQSAAAPMAAPGFKLTTFATAPAGASAPDSIAMVKGTVWIAYGNGGKPDGSDGGKSTIVEYSPKGKVLRTLIVVGHNDGASAGSA